MVFKKTKVELEIGEEYIWKLWIIYNISAIIEDSHCNTAVHGGLAKTLERVKRFFYWAKMAYQVREKVKSTIENPILGVNGIYGIQQTI